MKKAAIYVRTGSLDQVDKGRIEQQIVSLKEKVKKDGNSLEKDNIYCDAGYSGCDAKRPALVQMLRDVQDKKFEVLYVENIDRLSRNLCQFQILFSTLDDFGINIITPSGPYPRSAEDHLISSMKAIIHNYNQEKRAEIVRRGIIPKKVNSTYHQEEEQK